MSDVVHFLVEDAETVMNDATIDSKLSIENANTALAVITLILLTITVLIGWFSINQNVSSRLARPSAIMERLAGGDLSIEVMVKGNDEISTIGRTLEKLRKEAKQKEAGQWAQEQRGREMLGLATAFNTSVIGIMETGAT